MSDRIFLEMGVIFNNEKFHAGQIVLIIRFNRPDLLARIYNVFPDDGTFAVKLIALRDDSGWNNSVENEILRMRLSDVKGMKKFRRMPKLKKEVKE